MAEPRSIIPSLANTLASQVESMSSLHIWVDADACPKVIKEMNGFQLSGRSLIVNEARPKAAKG